MQVPDSPIQSLQKLKGLFDAGALTRVEFEFLKQKLIYPLLEENQDLTLDNSISITSAPPADKGNFVGSLTPYELVEEPEGEEACHPPKLNVDHLLALAGQVPEFPEKADSSCAGTPEPRLEQPSQTAASYPPFEPEKIVNFADFSPLRGREPKTGLFRSDNMLNLLLMLSIVALTAFGAHIYFNQDDKASEQLVSTRTQTAGGLSAAIKPVENPAPPVSQRPAAAEGEVQTKDSNTTTPDPLPARNTPTEAENDETGTNLAAPAEAPPAPQTSEPAAHPSDQGQGDEQEAIEPMDIDNDPIGEDAEIEEADQELPLLLIEEQSAPFLQDSSAGEEGRGREEGLN
jgi:hypothetical protein